MNYVDPCIIIWSLNVIIEHRIITCDISDFHMSDNLVRGLLSCDTP